MTLHIEKALLVVLRTVCPRVYPDVAPLKTTLPYVVYHQYGGQPVVFVEGALAEIRNSYVQINVWGSTRDECNRISLEIENVLVTSQSLQAIPLNELSTTFDEDASVRGSMQDFSIWGLRS
jgi:hypothetical protein